ncbi:MAG TPA: cobalamin B12-binding domain-containing protein [Steroidobacteraceae bacterium]|nr:cobalamin B12-binding domain-containing protein [Steroidobacteraceae bacterium]
MAGEQHSQESQQHCGWCAPEEFSLPARRPKGRRRVRPELRRIVEAEMIPRLLLMERPPDNPRPASPGAAFSLQEIEELARLLITHDVSFAAAYVAVLRQNGATTQEICLNLLPAAARRLGKLWEEDRCGFAEVTMGVSSLHQILHSLAEGDVPARDTGQEGRNVLLSCMPGEQHTFGVLVVSQFLRRTGWDARILFPSDVAQLLQSVRKKSFTIIGLTVGRESRVGELKSLVKSLRRASVNRRAMVMVGGPIFAMNPELAQLVGADGTASDAREAAGWMQGHWQSITVQT